MINMLWHQVKRNCDYMGKECKHCGFKTISTLKFIHHFKTQHKNVKLTKKDYKFFFKYSAVSQICKIIFYGLFCVIGIVLKIVLLPFGMLYEFL